MPENKVNILQTLVCGLFSEHHMGSKRLLAAKRICAAPFTAIQQGGIAMGKIRIAIAGVGNCASSLLQGIHFYREVTSNDEPVPGLMHNVLGGYRISDIEVVAAFDIDSRKVGKDVADAIYAKPNNTYQIVESIPETGVIVQKGPVLDGVAPHMKDYRDDVTFLLDKTNSVDVAAVLKQKRPDMLVNYLPVGSEEAVKYYVQCCLDAGVALVNCMPVFIASDLQWAKKFSDKSLPIVGDDIKAQVGATITHRVLTKLFVDRGVKLDRTYQLNVGGNSVTGDQELLILINNQIKKVKIGDLVDSFVEVYGKKRIDGKDIVITDETNQILQCFTIDREYNVKPSKIDALIRHRVSGPIYEVITEEGRSIKITGDHNVFVLSDDGTLEEIPVNMLKEGETYIAVPRILPCCKEKETDSIDLTSHLNTLFAQGVSNGYINIHNHPEIKIPVNFPITDDLLQIAGLWLADGNYDREGSSNIELACGNEPECMELIDRFTENLNINYNIRSDGIRVRLISKTLSKIFRLALGLHGNSYTKRMPEWVFNLSDRQVGIVLKGYMSGDGGVTGKQIRWSSTSKDLLNDIQTLLLRLGINSSVFKEPYGHNRSAYNSPLGYIWHGLISSKLDAELFTNKVNFIQDYKNEAAYEVCKRLKKYGTHRVPNIKLFKKWKIKSTTWHKHNSMRAHIIASQLNKIENEFEKERAKQIYAGGTRFLKIKSIKRIDTHDGYVYDISTKPYERFVCSNILVHNTDFLNMVAKDRLKSKRISKAGSVQSQLPIPLEPENVHIGPSDYVPWMKDQKVCFLRMEGRKFGNAPIELELRLKVEDSPNSAGVSIDAIRCCKLALDRKVSGPLISPSAYFMKTPPQQFPDSLAKQMVEEFINGERER
ncbi:MAG: hypothetical protein HZB67_03865 [Candidatus Aenigmarchaeota archaeon]|nr:hypothetical protein [Candidatus Aenigmarchaeota archaeon]